MNLSNKQKSVILYIILGVAGTFICGYSIGRNTAPVKVQEVTKVDHQTDIVTVVKEVTRPDGTKEKETTRTNKSNTVTNTAKVVETSKPLNKINIGTEYDIREVRQNYTLSYERRLLGNIWIGGTGNSNGSVGVTLGFEF